MMFQQIMWKVAMLLFITMMFVNVGVHAGTGVACQYRGDGSIDCSNGDAEMLKMLKLDEHEKPSDAVTNAAKEKW